jgi:tetratricopeptide (TPR) repeat protein
VNQPTPTFLSELRRRRVLHTAGAYIAIAWLVTEIASFLLEQISAPDWTLRLLAIVFVVGFPVAVFLAWVIRIQPGGKWVIDSSTGQRGIVVGAIVLGIVATAGLSWLILPSMVDATPAYEPIPNSLAILPLATPGGTPNQRTVAETVYSALLEGLDRSPELTQVRLRVEERPPDLAAFGREFRVKALLVGQVLQSAGATRIEMQLLDVGRGAVQWSHTDDWDPTRVMDISSGIANRALETLNLPAISRKRFSGTDSEEAYTAWLRAGRHHVMFSARELAIAIEEYRRAIELDPLYVRAYTGLASAIQVHAAFTSASVAEEEAVDEAALQLVEKALRIDPESPWAISALALRTQNPELSAQLFERALELDPNHSITKFRYALTVLKPNGELVKAEQLLRQFVDTDPLDPNSRLELAKLHWRMGRAKQSFDEMHRTIELSPESPEPYHWLGMRYLLDSGRFDQAIFYFRKTYSLNPEAEWVAVWPAVAYAELGMEEEALAWLEKGAELNPGYPFVHVGALWVHTLLGHPEIALDSARRLPESLLQNPLVGPRALAMLGSADIAAGQAERGLERWDKFLPEFSSSDGFRQFWYAVYFARNLLLAGETERARHLLQRCDEFTNSATIQVLLGERDEALAALHREIIENRRFETMLESTEDERAAYNLLRFDDPAYDFLREDPEFKKLEQVVRDRLARQRQHVEEMEYNGELSPAPGVVPVR